MDKIILTPDDKELTVVINAKEFKFTGDYKTISKDLIQSLGFNVEETPFEGVFIIYEFEKKRL